MKVIVEERGRQVTYELDDGGEPATIGRGLENAIPIRDRAASRKHARIYRGADGAILAEDLGSRNGTLLNGAPLKAKPLAPGDCLTIGEAKIWFLERREAKPSADAKPAAADAAPEPAPTKESRRRKALAEAPTAAAIKAPPAEQLADTREEIDLAPAAPAEIEEPPPPPGARPPKLVRRGRFTLEPEGAGGGAPVALDSLPFKIGRAKKNALVLTDGGVSAEHCEIVAREGGGCAIVDLGSTNGTKVNGGRVKRAVLADGARITIGAHVFVFRDADAPVRDIGAPSKQTEMPRARAAAPVKKRVSPMPLGDLTAPVSPDPDAGDEALAGAAAGFGEGTAATIAVEEAPGGGRAVAAIVLGFLGIGTIAAGAFAISGLLRPGEALEPDPPPPGNRVANWSFEDGGRAAIAEWKAVCGSLAVEARGLSGGARAARLEGAGGGPGEAANAAAIALSGLEVQVRGAVSGGRTAAGLAVVWESSSDPKLRLVSTTDLQPGPGTREAKATFRPPPGADRARVALVGDGALFDRVALAEREAWTRRAAGSAEARGLSVRWDERGILELSRDDRPIAERAGLALLGEGPWASLARQESPLDFALVPGATSKAPAAPVAATFAGKLLTPRGEALGVREEIGAAADLVRLAWKLATPVEGVAPALVLYIADAARATPAELARRAGDGAGSGEIRAVEPPFLEADVTEVAFGSGVDRVAFRPKTPARVEAAPLGRGLLVTIAAPAGTDALEVAYGRGSASERQTIEARFEGAARAAAEGRLEDARRAYARIAREFGHDLGARTRAEAEEQALRARAEAALAEGVAVVSDVQAMGVPALIDAARARLEFVERAYPGTAFATRAREALERLKAERERLLDAGRAGRAEARLAKAREHTAARRYRLARLLLEDILESYADVPRVAADARKDLEFVARSIAAEGGGS